MINPLELSMVLPLTLSAFLGAIIGLERERIHKPAGVRTYILVTMGSTLFTQLSTLGFSAMSTAAYDIDPTRIVASILTGIGFIGAGVIIHHSNHEVQGITTAAGLWMAAAIGVAIGLNFYLIAIFATLLALFTLLAIGFVLKS